MSLHHSIKPHHVANVVTALVDQLATRIRQEMEAAIVAVQERHKEQAAREKAEADRAQKIVRDRLRWQRRPAH